MYSKYKRTVYSYNTAEYDELIDKEHHRYNIYFTNLFTESSYLRG